VAEPRTEWERLTANKKVLTGRVGWRGLIVFGPANAAGYVTVYAGVDAGSRRFGAFPAGAGQAAVYNIPDELPFDEGLYVEFDANIVECIVLYRKRPGP
jgi:hypothetical protein